MSATSFLDAMKLSSFLFGGEWFIVGSSVIMVSDSDVAESSWLSLSESDDSDSSSSWSSSSLPSSDACDTSPPSSEANDAEATDGSSTAIDSIDTALLLLFGTLGFTGES